VRASKGIESAKNVRISAVISIDFSSNAPPPRMRRVIGSASRSTPTAAGIVKNNILWIVVWILDVYRSFLPLFIAEFRVGKIATVNAIPNMLTGKLWIFLAKLNAAIPPSVNLIPTIVNAYRFSCQAIRLMDLGIISLMIFLNPGCFTFNSGRYLNPVEKISTNLMSRCSVAPMSTPVAALYIPSCSFKKTTPTMIPRL
jgi:hypothetical protein